MTDREIRVIKKILKQLAPQQPLTIFEYGSGHSTVYSADYLSSRGISFTWTAIDNDQRWADKVKKDIRAKNLADQVTVFSEDFLPYWKKKNWQSDKKIDGADFSPAVKAEFDYITKPNELGKKYDLIIVDGRFRRRCLEVTAQCLKPGGLVFLHDAERQYYRPGLRIHKAAVSMSGGRFSFFQRRDNVIALASDSQATLASLEAVFNKQGRPIK